MSSHCLVLRLAGPLQSWGSAAQFNRRTTEDRPTKSGILGLLAAATGRRREDPIEDLLGLELGIRVDQPGSLLRDFHTVSDFRGVPLLSSSTNAKGLQKPTSPKKPTHVTNRYYIQDGVFVAGVGGPEAVLTTLAEAVTRPRFPLSLGRRACVPTQPLVISHASGQRLWHDTVEATLRQVPWQASQRHQNRVGATRLPVTLDDPDGDDLRYDVPISFETGRRGMRGRRVRHTWVPVGSRVEPEADDHDPFSLLGG